MNPKTQIARLGLMGLLLAVAQIALASGHAPTTQSRVFEWTFESQKVYPDPFNDVDVDVIFAKGGDSWKVPTFWRGGSKWTVRFAAPAPGEYSYHLESTDTGNPDLNGHEGRVTITSYQGPNLLLKRGMLRVSANKRYFEQADGTPFYWLGDTWWSGMSTRLSWEGFQKLTADRKAKGFTVVQIVAGLVPGEEQSPSDPGYCNEGGCVWNPGFKQINPKFFDFADRRVQHLVDSEIAPAIVGAWSEKVGELGVAKLKKHWRYVIARYGAYPVFWIVGGEVSDPPGKSPSTEDPVPGGWTEIARYLRATDPYHHPITVHEVAASTDLPLQDESLTDFHLFQPSHADWSSIAVEVAQLDLHYARTDVTKPLVVGEIGYERLGGVHLEDFQRVAFWLSSLNGAAGFTYGANGVWESYTADKQFHRWKWSFMTWDEAMSLPGSYQVGLGAKLVRQYPWWRFEPHPEWLAQPRGTTFFEPRAGEKNQFRIGVQADWGSPEFNTTPGPDEWKEHNGNFRLPYAAGVPREVRFIYVPSFGLLSPPPPTILGLEPGVRYHAYYWEPSYGIKFDLGAVEAPLPGPILRQEKFEEAGKSSWSGNLLNGVNQKDLAASVGAHSDAEAGLVLRFHDAGNYVAAVYSPKEKTVYLLDRKDGVDGKPLAGTAVPVIGSNLRLSAEVRGGWAEVSVTDGQHTYSSEIVSVSNTAAGGAGLLHKSDGATLELRQSPTLVTDTHLEKKLFDAQGTYRGEMVGPGMDLGPPFGAPTSWDDFGKEKILLLDSYRPERLPAAGDWVLVLENRK
jgi:Protein of unknown function (DUF4038)/Domain of unknown function (DUF5060)